MPLDPKTLLLAVLLVVSLLGAGCVLIGLQDRSQNVVLWMTAACISFCLGMVGRVMLPFLPAIAVGNALVFLSYGLTWSACRSLRLRPVRRDLLAVPGAIWLVLCLIPAFRHSTDLRISISGLMIVAQVLVTMREIWLMRLGALIIRAWLLLLFGFQVVMNLWRAIPLLVHAHLGNASFNAMPGILPTMFDALVFSVLLAFGLIALSKDLSDARHRQAARSDFITGVANRRYFEESLQRHFERATKNGRSLALLMIDADDFKGYNDLYGHPEGDKCLRALSSVFLATCRPGDVVGRYGGEEFAILLPNTSARAAHPVANRLLTAVRDLRLKHARRPSGFVTVSVGIAALTPGNDGGTASDLVEAADRALYRAKKEGRDRVCQAIDECECLSQTSRQRGSLLGHPAGLCDADMGAERFASMVGSDEASEADPL
jgi:diguanylate cyclase (GGDEF)-like protein